MKTPRKIKAMLRPMGLVLSLLIVLSGAQFTHAQAPAAKDGPLPKMPFTIEPDSRVEQRSYHFTETDEDLKYVLYVSSKVTKDKKNPLIVALHGLGGDGNFLVRDRLVDLAEEGGYIVVGPLGYNVGGWYGSPIVSFNKQPVDPPNLKDLSEKDVMAVLAIMRKEFNIDDERTYLMGHSMGGAGALFLGSKYTSDWAAIAGIAPAAFLMLPDRKEYLSKINDANIPVMIVQGDKDTAVPVNTTRQWVDTMKELGMKYEYIEITGGDHGTVIGDGMPDVFRFFAEHPKSHTKNDALSASRLTCEELSTDTANGLAGNPNVKSATSRIVPAAGPNVAHCQVDILYGTNPEQNINIRVGLPLNSSDGGNGGVEGAWNGRTEGTGGGGCSGSLNVTGAVNAGYVGSGNDTGHSGGDCEPGVNADGTYNLQFINDFIRNGMKQQILFSKAVAARYYGIEPAYNYWNGCSTGGRQGYVLAQELGNELDGILASAPAIYWTRFQTAQMWGQVVMKELTGGPIASAKLAQTTASAVAACDADDGVTDGVIDDPRTCTFSAKTNVCGSPTSPASDCLTEKEAEAIDMIWDGPRNPEGNKIWFGLERGTDLGGGFLSLNSERPFALGVTQFHWDEHDRNFDWSKVTVESYAKVAENGSRNVADLTDTFGDLDTFKQNGGKLLTFVGANDTVIMPRGVIHYYRQMASHYGGGKPDFEELQSFYRLFRAPGVGHCGLGGEGPPPQNLFEALVDWVEKGKAPETIPAQTKSRDGKVTRSRPLCPYPLTAIYDGSGSTDDDANFHCGGNLETPEVVCRDVLVKYKQEANGPLDYSGTGVNQSMCAK